MTAVKPNRKTSAPDQRFDPGYFHVLSRHGWFTAYGKKARIINSKGKKTIKKLKSKKQATIKVRAYKKVSGKMYYGKWSEAKKVIIK